MHNVVFSSLNSHSSKQSNPYENGLSSKLIQLNVEKRFYHSLLTFTRASFLSKRLHGGQTKPIVRKRHNDKVIVTQKWQNHITHTHDTVL